MDTGKGMSEDMYNFILENMYKVEVDLENGLIKTAKNTNGTICSSTGYLKVKINKKTLQVHQLLAVAYFGEKCIGYQINHIDGNKLNNKKENLEIVTRQENIRHQIENNLSIMSKKVIKVDKLDLEGNYICTYDSIMEASRDVGCNNGMSISRALKREIKIAKGFKWRISE